MIDARASAEAYLRSPLAKFRPWVDPLTGASPQRDFLQAVGEAPVTMFRAGNQSGKTVIECFCAISLLCGWHPHRHFAPPIHGWVSALDWEWGIGQVIWPTMQPFIPWDRVRSVLWYRRGEPSLPGSIILDDGSQLDFKSAETGRRKYQGRPLHFVALDEEHPSDIVEECRARLLRYDGVLWAGLTPVRRERWVAEIEKEPTTRVVRASTMAAARAIYGQTESVTRFARSLPDRQRAVRIEGDMAALAGLVYPTFARETHTLAPRGGYLWTRAGRALYPWPLPEHWRRFAGVDFGYANPCAIPLIAEDPATGRWILERCYYLRGMRASRLGALLLEALPPLEAPLVADHDASERAELDACGVATVPADKDVVLGIEAVERALHPLEADGLPGFMVIVDEPGEERVHPVLGRFDGEWFCWEAERYLYPEGDPDRPSPKDLPIKKDDHCMDSVRYLILWLECERLGGAFAPRAFSEPAAWLTAGYRLAAPGRGA